MLFETAQECLQWKASNKSIIIYKSSDLFSLYLILKDNRYSNLKRFFFGVSREPPVKEALKILKGFEQRLGTKALTALVRLEDQKPHKSKVGFVVIPLYHFLYEIDFEDVPLYVNSSLHILQLAANWRLKLGY